MNISYIAPLIETVLATMSGGSADDRRAMARGVIEALQPRDIVEAMFVARIIAAHHAAMDSYRRAAQPGVADDLAIRLRANAIATGRAFDAARQALEQRRAAAENASRPPTQAARANPVQPTPPTQPRAVASQPLTSAPQPVPRDKSGKPISSRYENGVLSNLLRAATNLSSRPLNSTALSSPTMVPAPK
jgi:hypothetical protein